MFLQAKLGILFEVNTLFTIITSREAGKKRGVKQRRSRDAAAREG